MARGYDDRMKRKKMKGVRAFVRDLFINGFRDRTGLNELADNKKRAADENRQIIASILREYYKFEKKDGERYFIAIDTRQNRHNPIHNIWKTKAFSGADIMMHFYILDYLSQHKGSNREITKVVLFEYLESAASHDENDEERFFEKKDGTELSLSKKLTESKLSDMLVKMTELGLITRYRGTNGYCYVAGDTFDADPDLLDFASEVMPVGTIGSYLIDRQETHPPIFAFKHNMISQALDDEVMYILFEAINEHREVRLEVYSRASKEYSDQVLLPLFIMRNVQTGRQYAACWAEAEKKFKPVRLDYINVDRDSLGGIVDGYEDKRRECKELYKHSWGVNLFYTDMPPRKVSFTIQVDESTEYVAKRLEREKRNGRVEALGDWKYRFSMDLYDPIEILPWITTFYGCIVELEIDDEEAMAKLKANFEKMMRNHLTDDEQEEVLHA